MLELDISSLGEELGKQLVAEVENNAWLSVLKPLFPSEQHSLSSSNFCSVAFLFHSSTCLKKRMKSWSDVCRDAWQSSKHQSNVLTPCVLFIESLITEEGVALLPQKACSNDGGVKLFSLKLETELLKYEV